MLRALKKTREQCSLVRPERKNTGAEKQDRDRARKPGPKTLGHRARKTGRHETAGIRDHELGRRVEGGGEVAVRGRVRRLVVCQSPRLSPGCPAPSETLTISAIAARG